MPRKVKTTFRKRMSHEETSAVEVFLVTITQPDNDDFEPIRVSSQALERIEEQTDETMVAYGVRSRGLVFLHAGFEVGLGEDTDGSAPTVELSIPNVSRDIITAIETLDNRPLKVTIEMVFADNPDVPVMTLSDFDMTNIQYDDDTITGTISRELLFSEPVPMYRFTPTYFPSMGW